MAGFGDWAGTRVVGRGKGYKGEVEDLSVTENGFLLAWVHGNRKYATKVAVWRSQEN